MLIRTQRKQKVPDYRPSFTLFLSYDVMDFFVGLEEALKLFVGIGCSEAFRLAYCIFFKRGYHLRTMLLSLSVIGESGLASSFCHLIQQERIGYSPLPVANETALVCPRCGCSARSLFQLAEFDFPRGRGSDRIMTQVDG